MIDINELHIVNYCHPDCVPLKSIMRLPRDIAFDLAQEMADRNQDTTAFFRFADFSNYYPLRIEAEKFLRESFIKLGGNPKEQHPLSFVLQGSSYLDHWFDHGIIKIIPLCQIDSEDISFVYGDSTANFQRTGKLSVLTKEMLLTSIRKYPGTINQYMQEIEINNHYIEAQLWNDKLLVNNLK